MHLQFTITIYIQLSALNLVSNLNIKPFGPSPLKLFVVYATIGQHSSKRPRNFCRFNKLTKNQQGSLITTCTKTYFKHADANGGSCARWFADNLMASVREKVALMDITKENLVNKFWQIKKQRKDEQEKNEMPLTLAYRQP